MNVIEFNPILAWISTSHVIIALIVILILFGGKKLPEFAKGLARGLRTFKDELHSVKRDLEEEPTPPKENDPALRDPLPGQQPQEPKNPYKQN